MLYHVTDLAPFIGLLQNILTFFIQKRWKLIQNVMLNLTFLRLFIRLFLSNFVFFQACLKLIPLFLRYINMYPRVLYTKSNLSLCLFNMWNMSLIWPEMPEIRGMWENKWSSGHPLVPVARFLFRLHFSDLILSLKSWDYNNVGLLHESMAWFVGLAREVLHSGTLLNEWNVRAPYLIWLIFRYPVLPLLER